MGFCRTLEQTHLAIMVKISLVDQEKRLRFFGLVTSVVFQAPNFGGWINFGGSTGAKHLVNKEWALDTSMNIVGYILLHDVPIEWCDCPWPYLFTSSQLTWG